MDYREIVSRLGYLDVLRRLYSHKAATESNVYFGQLPILEYVAGHDGCTQREVADMMHVSPPSIATSVKRMQRAELLSKKTDENDLRYTRLSVTPKGIAAAEECRRRFDEIDRRMLSGITPEECDLFAGILQRMIDNLAVGELKNMSFFALFEEVHRMKGNEREEKKTKEKRGFSAPDRNENEEREEFER
jgi:DNA-binding MarR family transcriptional regulator